MPNRPENPQEELTPERRRQAERLFKALDAMPATERTRAIQDADVDELVRAEVMKRDSALQETLGEPDDSSQAEDERSDKAAEAEEVPTISDIMLEGDEYSPRRIGPCTLKRLVGSGGMGRVFEAVQDHPRRTVALKIMGSALASKEAFARFEYEVQILGRLSHPNIAQVYDAGTWEENGVDLPYFIMEYVPGRMLNAYIQVNELNVDEILELFLQVCDAISHGHDRGIIHRDLKPGNILVDSKGRVKVIDFGVARATDSDMQITHAQTSAGQLIGTLQYMSPEQCAADPNDIDIRTDVYALGVVLFELLSNKLPYDIGGGSIPEAVRAIQESTPSRLSTVNSRIPRDLEVIVGKALEKNRERRYRSAGELGDDIRRFLDDEAIVARPPTLSEHIKRYARKHRAVATAVVIVAVTLVVSVISIIYFAVDANQQRGIAQKEAIAARAAEAETEVALGESEERFELLRSVFGDLFGDLLIQVKNLPGGTEVRQTMLSLAQKHLDDLKAVANESESVALQVQVARAHEAMGDLYGGVRTVNMGQFEQAREEYVEAERIWRELKTAGSHSKATALLSRVLLKQADLCVSSDLSRTRELMVESRRYALQAYEENPDDVSLIRLHYATLETLSDTVLESDTPESNATALVYLLEYRDLALKLSMEHPDVSAYRRDVALALRRIGYIRIELKQFIEAEEALRQSLAYVEQNQAQEPEHIRHVRDVSWSCWYLGTCLAMREKTEEAQVLMVRSATTILETCVRDPKAADYRRDVRDLVPAICDKLVQYSAPDKAIVVRQEAILQLQPLQEQDPKNDALIEVIEVIRTIQIASAPPPAE